MNSSPSHPRASIVIPCFNQLGDTRRCVSSLMRFTFPSWELIVIDNGCNDGTEPYFQGVQDTAAIPISLVKNSTNRGFPIACNQGLSIAKGEYLVLLNNDTVVTDGWLDQLIALADSADDIGMVGPMSNYVNPPQLVENVPYATLEEMPRFAEQWRRDHLGQWFEVEKLSGFCLLIKRQVYEQIGGLDEGFGLGLFDDDDYSLRARRAGWRLAAAHDLFIHHSGSRTIASLPIDTEALLNANQERFAAKWGLANFAAIARPVAVAPWSGRQRADSGPLAVRPSVRQAKVSLTMIVRNEEFNLPACLQSAQGLFDEIVVVDTGSTDRTKEIARSFGARVFDFVWVDDFAAARNAALARATGDYAFWLDADDVIEPDQRAVLLTLLSGLPALNDDDSPDSARRANHEASGVGVGVAYVVRCACDPDRRGGGGATVVDHVRLFPVREDVRWSYRVHEQILPAIRAAGIPVRWSEVVVRHTGYVDSDVRRRKLARDEAILRDELRDRPDDPFIWFNLGSIAIEQQDWRTAIDGLKRSLAGSAPTDSIVCKLYALIARGHQMLSEWDQALRTCAEGLRLDPNDAELLFRQGMILRQVRRDDEAEASWSKVLTLKRPERFASLDMGIYGHLTKRNLAVIAAEKGRLHEALLYWREILIELPDDAEAREMVQRLGRELELRSISGRP